MFWKKKRQEKQLAADQALAEKLYVPETWQDRHPRRARFGRIIPMSHSFPMPGRQPCPKCGGWKPRDEKVEIPTAAEPARGAVYDCNKHGKFIVYR